jgi:hypothetical protein
MRICPIGGARDQFSQGLSERSLACPDRRGECFDFSGELLRKRGRINVLATGQVIDQFAGRLQNQAFASRCKQRTNLVAQPFFDDGGEIRFVVMHE